MFSLRFINPYIVMAKTKTQKREKKYFAKYKEPLVAYPNMLETQLDSFKWLITDGLKEVFKEFSPIEDYSGKKFELRFDAYELGEPKFDPHYAKENKMSYEAPLKIRAKLLNKLNGSKKEQEIFMTDFPLMTSNGTFIINGVERVIVPQLTRSSGVFFTAVDLKGRRKFGAKIIPNRGVWIEIETDKDDTIFARISLYINNSNYSSYFL